MVVILYLIVSYITGSGMMLAEYSYGNNRGDIKLRNSWLAWILLPVIVPFVIGYVVHKYMIFSGSVKKDSNQ